VAISRRQFVNLAAGVAFSGVISSPAFSSPSAKPARIRAIAFDAFPIFDPRPIARMAENLYPGKGALLMDEWRRRQFEYSWLRTAAKQYVDFWQVTEQALTFAIENLGLVGEAATREKLMTAYLKLKAWPEVPAVLKTLRGAGLRMAFLSNFTPRMLDQAITNSGLAGLFEDHLSTDRVREFKPSPTAYRMALEQFGLRRDQIAFVASAGWDAAGAKWFGYPTVWINRTGERQEELGAPPDLVATSLGDLQKFVL
jgi:2-haloacid dehalogenase